MPGYALLDYDDGYGSDRPGLCLWLLGRLVNE
jgi:hypothetical protein